MTKAWRIIRVLLLLLILAGGVVLCMVRWDAWFSMPEEPRFEGDTITPHFRSFRTNDYPCQRKDSLHLVLLGDVHNTLTNADYNAIADSCKNIDVYAQLGDFVEREQFYYLQQLLHQLDSTCFDTLPLLHVAGNHEYTKGIRPNLDTMWFHTFSNPDNGPLRFHSRSYYVDFYDMRFIAIDTNPLFWLSDYMVLNTWVKQTIQSAYQPWVIVMMHHPVYSSRSGRANPLIWASMVRALRGADVVFSGHDHVYARLGKPEATDIEDNTPIYVSVTSTTKARQAKQKHHFDYLYEGGPYYIDILVTHHSLQVAAREVRGGHVIDRFEITK